MCTIAYIAVPPDRHAPSIRRSKRARLLVYVIEVVRSRPFGCWISSMNASSLSNEAS